MERPPPVNNKPKSKIINVHTTHPAIFSIKNRKMKLMINAARIEPKITHLVVIISLEILSNVSTSIEDFTYS